MALALLGGLTPRAFLARHWQKRPLFVCSALPGFKDPLTPDELLRLACEEEVESRLVLVRGGRGPYQRIDGPQDRRLLRRLPRSHWSLLVQSVDRLSPAVAALLDHFAFIPRWRIDDVMISFAVRGGSVGPHVDNYDVFLIQGRGQRRWQLQQRPERTLRSGLDLQVLRHFDPDDAWTLAAGDMLYVPPGVAHYGVALEDCLTYSVGFRAPSHRALVALFAERLIDSIPEHRLYADPDLRPAGAARGVERRALDRMQEIVKGEVRRGLRLDLRSRIAELVSADARAAGPKRTRRPR